MEVDENKENQDQVNQMVARKGGVLNMSTPRTPFAEVNRPTVLRTNPHIKAKQALNKRQSWAPNSIRMQVFEEKTNPGEISKGKSDTVTASMVQSCPASCVDMQKQSQATEGPSPVVSRSCPEMLSSDISLPSISETPPSKQKTTESYITVQSDFCSEDTPDSPEIDLSMVCEEATPLNSPLVCESGSELQDSHGQEAEQSMSALSDFSSGSWASALFDSSIQSDADSSPTQYAAQLMIHHGNPEHEISLENDTDAESVAVVHSILEEVLSAIEEGPQDIENKVDSANVDDVTSDKSACNAASLITLGYKPHTFMREYAKFVETYMVEGSPDQLNATSSLTDVSPFSQTRGVERDRNNTALCCSQQYENAAGSLSPVISDVDDSLSSTDTVQRHLAFNGGDTSPESSPEKSTGFVRSSQSLMDLREGGSADSSFSRDSSPEFLNLSLSEQKVEFFALPPTLKSTGTSPMAFLSHDQECSPIIVLGETSNKDSCTIGTSPILSGQGAQMMRASIASGSLSPMVMPASKLSPVPEVVQTPSFHAKLSATVTTNVGLSPISLPVCERETNTNTLETHDADTMTRAVLTSEVALSPVAKAVKDTDTMTTVAGTVDRGMVTDASDCHGRRNVCTTMTPHKVLAKQGRRLTSDDIRKQHPRALANQLETLMVANERLDSEARSAQQEHKKLRAALKTTQNAVSTREEELASVVEGRTREWQDRERQQEEKCHRLEEQCVEQGNRVTALELELSALKAEDATRREGQAEELASLENKCREMEEQHAQRMQQYEQEIETLRTNEKTNSYQQQFERAQQMVREREAELSEIRGLFDDLQTTAHKQEQVHLAHKGIHEKIVALAKENRSLKELLAQRACLSRQEAEEQQKEMEQLQQQQANLTEELVSLRNTMNINNTNLGELERLYSSSSSDLLSATGKVVELNTELFETRKALEEMRLSKEALALQASEVGEQLSTMNDRNTSLCTALQQSQAQLQQLTAEHEHLEELSHKMKKIYEDKIENMALGVENLQRTLMNRETDLEHLEKELYQCRNVIVQQRYKMESLENQLQEAQDVAAKKTSEEEDIAFYKESNAFLEAERALYVRTLRDLEEKLKDMSEKAEQQQQAAGDTEQLLEEVQEDKLRLISELSDMQSQFLSTSKALKNAEEERVQVESVATMAASDLLQHMQLMLGGLKQKIGLQDVPELSSIPETQPQPKPQFQPPPSRSFKIKSKRHSRRSFVSKILGAAIADRNDEDDRMETGSYLGEETVPKTGARGHRDPNLSCGNMSSSFRGVSPLQMNLNRTAPETSTATLDDVTHHDSRRKLNFSSHQTSSASMMEGTGSRPDGEESGTSAFRPAIGSHSSSSSFSYPPRPALPFSLSRPPASAVAKIRTIPKTQRRSEPPSVSSSSFSSPTMKAQEEEGREEAELLAQMRRLKEVFADIARLTSIVERATHLSLQDLREENNMLRERTEILEDRAERNSAELNISRQEHVAKDNTIAQLQHQSREMTERMMAITDNKFEVKRLSDEVKQLQQLLQQEQREKEAISTELNNLLEASASSDNGAAQARSVRDVVSLKKKNQQLLSRLEEQRDHYEELGSKAARRMRVLDNNWKKAEDEVYRLDDLVENIREIVDQATQSASPGSELHHILQLIRGDL